MDIYVVFYTIIQQHLTGYISVKSIVKVVETTLPQFNQVVSDNHDLIYSGVMYELFLKYDDIFKERDKVEHK